MCLTFHSTLQANILAWLNLLEAINGLVTTTERKTIRFVWPDNVMHTSQNGRGGTRNITPPSTFQIRRV